MNSFLSMMTTPGQANAPFFQKVARFGLLSKFKKSH